MRQKKKLNKNIIAYLVVVIGSILFMYFGNKLVSKDLKLLNKNPNATPTTVAKVTKEVNREYLTSPMNPTMREVALVLEGVVVKGENVGQTITFKQSIQSPMGVNPPEAKIGNKVLLSRMKTGENEGQWIATGFVRSTAFIWLALVFFGLLVLFGKMQGVHTIVSLSFTCLSIFLIFVPSILSGYNIYLSSILICLYIIVMTLLIISGWNHKSLAAAIGCFGGVLIAGILTFSLSSILKLTGLIDEDAMYVLLINPENPINLKAIIFAGVIIGALGAAMDVAMSIASSLNEICEKIEKPTFKEIVTSGINIGRDIMGTMANTLILAYIGSSLSTVLLLISYQNSLLELFNIEMIIVEMMQAIVGSFGILFTIPVSALVCGFLYPKLFKPKKQHSKELPVSEGN